jgi:hypothetical protein
MRLLFVLPAYEPAWPLGGVVRCMANLCRGLVRAGHSVAVYTLNTDGKGGELSYPCDIPVDQVVSQVYYHRSTFGSRVSLIHALLFGDFMLMLRILTLYMFLLYGN